MVSHPEVNLRAFLNQRDVLGGIPSKHPKKILGADTPWQKALPPAGTLRLTSASSICSFV